MYKHIIKNAPFVLSLLAVQAQARFESFDLWNAEYAALGGASVSRIDDSSAVYFNPAGLAFAERADVSLHLSPLIGQTSGPVAGTFTDGETQIIPAMGGTGSYIINDRLVLGYGIYAIGGLSSLYEDILVGSGATAITGDYYSEMAIMEGAMGLGYRLDNNWSLGASYRITYTEASLSMVSAMGPVGAEIKYEDMTGINAFGYRLGVMYRSDDDRFGWGMHYRSAVDMEADGKASYRNGVNMGGYTDQDVTVKTELPWQLATGAHYTVLPDLTLFGEITYTNYSAIDTIEFSSSDTDLAVSEFNTQWQDQTIIGLGAEYTGLGDWALRTGYIYTTNSVKEEYADPTFPTPDTLHTFTLGTGTRFMDDQLKFDAALQYSVSDIENAKGGGELSPGAASPSGHYESTGVALHTSLVYYF